MADENLDDLKAHIALQERSLASEAQKQEIMKAGGIHYTQRRQHAAELLKIQDEILSNREQVFKVESKINVAASKQAAIMKTMTMIQGGLLAGLEKIIDLQKKYSELTTATKSTLGLNVKEAQKMNDEIHKSITGEKMHQTTLSSVVDMQNELNDAFDGAVKFTGEQAVNMDITAKKLGISNAHAAKFSKLMFLSGEASGEVAMNTLAGVKSLSDASGVKFSAVMKDIAASGKEMMSYFGGSATEIAIMAVKARKLGFELADMKSTSESLLDVEGRIEKQMSLNMLTGKNINLDKATQLTLEGDMIGAQKEVLAQLGDVSQMNIMERKLASEMLGMDVMKIANAGELAKQADESAAAAAEIATMEAEIRAGQLEEFANKEIERQLAKDQWDAEQAFLQNVEEKKAIAAGKAIEDVELANHMQKIQMAIQGIMVLQAAASSLKAATEKQSLGAALKALPSLIAGGIATMAKAVGGIFSTLAQIPFGLGIPIAIGAVAGMFALGKKATTMFDGVIDPKKGMVVNGPKGSIQLDKDDTIIAGTDLGGGKDKSGKDQPSLNNASPSAGMNIGPLVKKIDELILAVRQSRVLSVDGYQLNEVLHLEKTPSGV